MDLDGIGDVCDVCLYDAANDAASMPAAGIGVPALAPAGIFLLIFSLLLTALAIRRRTSAPRQ